MRTAPRELPVFYEIVGFLEGKFTALESINRKKQIPINSTENKMAFKETLTTSKQPQRQFYSKK